MKICRKCGEEKPEEDFYIANHCKDGRARTCKKCTQSRQVARAARIKAEIGSAVLSGEKTCTRCGETKPSSEFYRQYIQNDGFRSDCKKCSDAYHRDYKAKNVESLRKYRKAYNERPGMKQWMEEYLKKSPRHALRSSLSAVRKRKHLTDNPVTLDELCKMFEDQSGQCAISGLPLTWRQGQITSTSMSIDRIDCNGGYTRENVRLVCYAVNAFRGRMSDGEMLAIARAIISKAEESEPSWKGFGYAAPISTLTVN